MGFRLQMPFSFTSKNNAKTENEGRFIKLTLAGDVGVFHGDINTNDLVRDSIHANATHTSKAVARVFRLTEEGITESDATKKLARTLNYTPNYRMNGRDFLYKSRALYELHNVVYILVDRAPDGTPVAYYPIPTKGTAIENKNDKLIGYSFNLRNGKQLLAQLSDLIIIKKYQSTNDYYPDDDLPLLSALGMLDTADKSLKNAVNLSTKIRGILKVEKSILDPKDLKTTRDEFVKDYIALENESGVAALDGTSTFTPVDVKPTAANSAQIKLYENRIMRFFGVNENILTNTYDDEQWIAYYQGSIEPFLLALTLEMTIKSFSDRERGFGNEIRFESNRMSYASNQSKMNMVSLVDRGVLTLNEYREILNMSPVPDGDVRVIRKEYMSTDDLDENDTENEEDTQDADES